MQHTSVHTKRYILLILLNMTVFSTAMADKANVVNFQRSDYGAANKNWSIAQDNDGVMYFGNDKPWEVEFSRQVILFELNHGIVGYNGLLNISLRGVENSRCRLRKKLGLTPDQNLTEFFMKY